MLDAVALVLSLGLSLVAFQHLLREVLAGRRYAPSKEVYAGLGVLGAVPTALTTGWVLGSLEPRFAKWCALIFVGLAIPIALYLFCHDDFVPCARGRVFAGGSSA